jgi:hypothetical protein
VNHDWPNVTAVFLLHQAGAKLGRNVLDASLAESTFDAVPDGLGRARYCEGRQTGLWIFGRLWLHWPESLGQRLSDLLGVA